MIKAIIFDKDGVIVDSEPIQFQAFKEEVAQYGGVFTLEDHKKICLGKGSGQTYVILAKKYHIDDVESFTQNRRERYQKLSMEKLQMRIGALKLIQTLYKHFPLAVASGSLEKILQHDLDKFNLSQYFKIIVSGQYHKSKPDPELFLVTAGKLGIAPNNCLVIEDTESGVQAAKNAGMKCIAVPHAITAHQNFNQADIIVHSMGEINWSVINNLK